MYILLTTSKNMCNGLYANSGGHPVSATFILEKNEREVDFFHKFLPVPSIQKIVEKNNRYATMKKNLMFCILCTTFMYD